MKIYGNIICQDTIADVIRAIESLYPICDEILVADGGSKDGTRELLEDRKEIYKLKIYDHPFTTIREQRQFLLEKTPPNNWVVTIDQDEKLSLIAVKEMREYLLEIRASHYQESRERNIPFIIPIPHLNLMNHITTHDGEPIIHYQKIFFYREGLRWDFDDYFAHITYQKPPVSFLDKNDIKSYCLPAPENWIVLHYARLDPKRKSWRKEHLKKEYNKEAWGTTIKGVPIKEFPLPKEWM